HLERVVALVREADRHLAQGRELVVTADLAQVLGEADRAELVAFGVADDRAGDQDRDADAVLRHEGRLAVLALPHRRHHLAGLGEVGIEARHVLAEDLVRRVAEGLPRAVVVEGDGTLAIDGDHDVRGALEQLLEVDGGKARDGGHAEWGRAMLGGGGVRVKAVFALVLLAGCFWRTYGRLAATHVDLLVAMARKGTDLVASGRLSAESMPELTYPLERAEAFVHDARARSGAPPASLDALDTLCARYRAFVDALDRVRRERSGEAARAALADPLAAVEAAAERVRAELRAESPAAAGVPGRATAAAALGRRACQVRSGGQRGPVCPAPTLPALRLLPVGQEALEPDVAQRVLHELLEDRERAGGDVRAHLRRADDVERAAHARDQHLGRVRVVVEHLQDLRDEVHAVVTDVVEPPDEGGDEGGARLGGEEGLRGLEDQRHVHADAAVGEGARRLEPLGDHRALDHDVPVDAREPCALLDHAWCLRAHHLGAHRAVDEGADLVQHGLEVAARLRDQGRVGGDAVGDLERFRLDHLLVAEQDVEVDHARAPTLALHAFPPHRLLDRLQALQEPVGRELGLDLDHAVHEPRLGVADRLALVERGGAAQPRARQLGHAIDGLEGVRLAVAQVRSDPDVYAMRHGARPHERRARRLEVEPSQALDRLAQPLARAAQREPDVSLPRVAEPVARGDDDVRLLEAAAGEPGGAQAARDRHPDVERPARRIAGEADVAKAADQHVASLAIERAQPVDRRRVTGERCDGGLLHRLEHPRVDVGLHRAEPRDQLRVPDRE